MLPGSIPRRAGRARPQWKQFLTAQARGILAVDSFVGAENALTSRYLRILVQEVAKPIVGLYATGLTTGEIRAAETTPAGRLPGLPVKINRARNQPAATVLWQRGIRQPRPPE
jgi:hypothetical protein